MTNNIRNEAIQLHRQGQFTLAKSKYEQYLADHPDDADVCHAYGVLLGQFQDYTHAKAVIEKAIALKGNQASYFNSLGNVYHHLDEKNKAIMAYQTAIKKQPSYPSSYNNLGRIYMAQQKYQSAKKAFEKAISINENFADAHCNLGILLVLLSEDIKALAHLEKAIGINPNLITAIRQLSDIHLRHERFNEAILLLEKCISLTSQPIEDYHQIGIAYYKLKDFENAATAFEKVILLNSKHPEANQHLGNSILALGDHEKALNYYFRQLTNNPTMETYYNIGSLLMAKDRFQEARDYLLEAEKISPNDIAIQLNLGSLYLKGQDISSAILHYQKAAAITPDDDEIQHILSALTQNKLPKKAPSAYLQHLFDHYAAYYDKHLTACLQYDTPTKIASMITEEIETEDKQWRILDLGCGTGLSGLVMKPYAKELIGVDLSEQMLAVAREKEIYDILIQDDVETFLTGQKNINCVIAADVFTYIGELSLIFNEVHEALETQGLFAFSIEKTFKENFILQPSIRYAHNKNYIRELIAKYNFKELRFDNAVLRRQQNEPVEGYLVLVQKK